MILLQPYCYTCNNRITRSDNLVERFNNLEGNNNTVTKTGHMLLWILVIAVGLHSGCLEEESITRRGDIHLFTIIAHEEDITDERLAFVGTHFDVVLMTYPIPEFVDTLKSYNPDVVVLLFNNPYFACGDKFWKESVEDVAPEWLLRTESGEIIHYLGPDYGMDTAPLMDVRNSEWQQYYAEQSKKWVEYSGMDGLFIDTFTEKIPPWAVTTDGELPKGYTEEDWRESAKTFFCSIKRELKGYLIVYNGITNVPGPSHDLPNIEYLYETDGTAYEAFSIYLNMDTNEETKQYYFDHAIMTAMKEVVDANKIFIIQVTGRGNEESRLYALASFLLLQNDETYFYYAPDESGIYWYPEWETKIGHPLGEYYQKDGVYQRDFSNGRVLVNPGKKTVTVKLDGTYTVEGNVVTEITLKSKTGVLLLQSRKRVFILSSCGIWKLYHDQGCIL